MIDKPKLQIINIDDILSESLLQFASYTSRGVKIEWNLNENCKNIRGDKNQLIQLFLLIIENAIDAMNRVGTIEILSKCYNKNGLVQKIL